MTEETPEYIEPPNGKQDNEADEESNPAQDDEED